MAAHGRDYVSIAVAQTLEKAFGGYRFPGAAAAAPATPYETVTPHSALLSSTGDSANVSIQVRTGSGGVEARTGSISLAGRHHQDKSYATFTDDDKSDEKQPSSDNKMEQPLLSPV